MARGKATASVIGIPAMGQRFNVLMTIQVSLQQASPRRKRGGPAGLHACIWGLPHSRFQTSVPRTAYRMAWITGWSPCTRVHVGEEAAAATATAVALQRARGRARGTEYDVWKGLSIRSLQRNATEHVTVTVVIYHVVRGGGLTPQDVAAAIDDLESLYRPVFTAVAWQRSSTS